MPEIFKYILPALATSFLTYLFTNRGKQRDSHLQKVKELNTILSNMLVAWEYLRKLRLTLMFWEKDLDELVIPKEYLPVILLRSGILNENCFIELEKSVENLKQYDSITFYELEGIGKRIDVLRKSYILPLINTAKKTDETIAASRSLLDALLVDVEDSLKDVSGLISRKTKRAISEKISLKQSTDIGSVIEESNQDFYRFVVNVLPNEFGSIDYNAFKELFCRADMKEYLVGHIALLAQYNFEQLFEKLAMNPDASVDEISALLNDNNTQHLVNQKQVS